MKTLFILTIGFPLIILGQNQMSISDYAETITAKELKENLYVYASDYFQGRETGTVGQNVL